jgi:type I restriction enzyme S subunit
LKTAIDKKSGTALRRIILRDLKAIRIPLPTLAEQKRIATKLEGALAILGSLDVLLGKKENLFSELRNAMRDQIFQRVPAEAIKTLPQISKNLDSRRVPITKSVRSEGFVPYYGASGIVDHVADAIFDEELLLVSEDGANLLTRNTPIAFSISGPAWVNNHAHVICFQERVTQKYVELYFESISVADWVTGAAQPKLNQSALNSIPIRIPESLEEQQHVVEALLQLEAILDKERVQASDLESSSRALRKSILDSAFSGEF